MEGRGYKKKKKRFRTEILDLVLSKRDFNAGLFHKINIFSSTHLFIVCSLFLCLQSKLFSVEKVVTVFRFFVAIVALLFSVFYSALSNF